MKMKNTLFAGMILVSSASLYANAGAVVLQTFDLYDHPGGAVNPQAYGMRFDEFVADTPVTFSFEDGSDNSQVQLQVLDNSGQTQIRIFGTIHGNSALGGTNYGTFTLDIIYDVDVVANGFDDNHTGSDYAAGTMTGLSTTGDSPLGDGAMQDLYAHSDGTGSFRFLSDGHRLTGDDSSWVGRGWLTPDGSDRGATNDFLFTAVEVVPLPSAAFAGLLGLSLVGASHARRRRS